MYRPPSPLLLDENKKGSQHAAAAFTSELFINSKMTIGDPKTLLFNGGFLTETTHVVLARYVFCFK